jgi:hypothetical protein
MTATRTDETPLYAEGESFKTGSSAADERRDAYVDWLLTPEDHRDPPTKREFAERWGVSRQTLYRDAQEASVQKALAERARGVARVDRLPDVLNALYRIAIGENADGKTKRNRFSEEVFPSPAASVSAANALLGWMEQTKELRESVDFSEMSDEEITEAVMVLLKKREARATS